jgi:glycosyltransferase involved in cell wall biosynthesis
MAETARTVLHLSAVDFGGAGNFTLDFHRLWRELGHSSHLVVKDKKSSHADVMQYPGGGAHRIGAKLQRRLARLSEKSLTFDYDYYFFNRYERYTFASAEKLLSLLPARPDLIFVHWVTDFINARLIQELQQQTGAAVFWLMIDNAPLTGGCHYPWECSGYQHDCGNCPAVLPQKATSAASRNLAFKLRHLPPDLTLLAFSEQDYRRAKKSAVFKSRKVEKLLGFVDETKYVPGDRPAAQSHFGIPSHMKVIFFGASSPKERRKGMALLLRAIEALGEEDYFLLVAGTLPAAALPEEKVKRVGHLSEADLIRAYQAAYMFVCPSLEDSGPMMINQAIMCGTPVVAFDVGVAQDLVQTGKTGYRAVTGDYHDLARGMDYLLHLDADAYAQMQTACRARATAGYSREAYTNRLRELTEAMDTKALWG